MTNQRRLPAVLLLSLSGKPRGALSRPAEERAWTRYRASLNGNRAACRREEMRLGSLQGIHHCPCLFSGRWRTQRPSERREQGTVSIVAGLRSEVCAACHGKHGNESVGGGSWSGKKLKRGMRRERAECWPGRGRRRKWLRRPPEAPRGLNALHVIVVGCSDQVTL